LVGICRITADFAGTPEDPVVVESMFHERIIGVPDPEDDCLVVWDLIKENEPPKQIIADGDYFVLKHVPPEAWSGIPDSAHHASSSTSSSKEAHENRLDLDGV
jgi:hypothetical protein